MDKTYLIPIEECCNHYNVEVTFIDSLEEHGLIEPTIIEEQKYIDQDYLYEFERLVNLHYHLDVNLEGIEVITRLLKHIERMQKDMQQLRNLIKS